MSKTYFMGVDLGAHQQPTGLALLERELLPPGEADPATFEITPEYAYRVRYLERLPPGMSYPDQARRIRAIDQGKSMHDWKVTIVLDATAVGRPVVELIQEELLPAKRIPKASDSVLQVVWIVAQNDSSSPGSYNRIAKRDLIQSLTVQFLRGQLSIAQSLRERSALVEELDKLQMRNLVLAEGQDTWRDQPNDDLVFAVALAAWKAKKTIPSPLGKSSPLYLF